MSSVLDGDIQKVSPCLLNKIKENDSLKRKNERYITMTLKSKEQLKKEQQEKNDLANKRIVLFTEELQEFNINDYKIEGPMTPAGYWQVWYNKLTHSEQSFLPQVDPIENDKRFDCLFYAINNDRYDKKKDIKEAIETDKMERLHFQFHYFRVYKRIAFMLSVFCKEATPIPDRIDIMERISSYMRIAFFIKDNNLQNYSISLAEFR